MYFRYNSHANYTKNSFGQEIGPPPDADDLETVYDGISGIRIFVQDGKMMCRIGSGADFELHRTYAYPELRENDGGYLFDISGKEGAAHFEGGTYGDILKGGNAADELFGRSGNDQLHGGGGADVLDGSSGADLLRGGKGADTLTGGSETFPAVDVFLFKSIAESRPSASGRDLITDFSRAQNDEIDLHFIDANTHRSGNQAFSFIGHSQFHDVAGELRYVKTSAGTYVSADVNGDGAADFSIEFTGAMNLRAGDFSL